MHETELVTIKEAAERLGVSPDTVRRRLKRGELTGEHETTPQGFVWRVAFPTGERASETPGEPATVGGDAIELARLRERVAGLERLTTELSEDRNAWREQAARSEESARELRILVQQAQALAQALPAGDDFLQDAHTASPAGPRAPEAGAMTPDTLHRPSRVGGLIRRLFGRG